MVGESGICWGGSFGLVGYGLSVWGTEFRGVCWDEVLFSMMVFFCCVMYKVVSVLVGEVVRVGFIFWFI